MKLHNTNNIIRKINPTGVNSILKKHLEDDDEIGNSLISAL